MWSADIALTASCSSEEECKKVTSDSANWGDMLVKAFWYKKWVKK
jgi:hypothetical protein